MISTIRLPEIDDSGVRQYLEIGQHMGYFRSPNQNFTEIYHYN